MMTALVACIESLEAENRALELKLVSKKPRHFCLEDIAHNDSLVCQNTVIFTIDSSYFTRRSYCGC